MPALAWHEVAHQLGRPPPHGAGPAARDLGRLRCGVERRSGGDAVGVELQCDRVGQAVVLAVQVVERAALPGREEVGQVVAEGRTGEAVPVSMAASSFSLGVAMLTMFWQYCAAFRLVFVPPAAAAVGLDPVGVGLADTEVAADQQLRVVDREQRDRALLVLRAESSFSACDALAPAGLVGLGP